MMRTFVIADIHGNNEAFRKALKAVKLKKVDRLILLGDYIDRGFDSKGVLDTILLLKEHQFDIICLRGNHEQMLLDALLDTNKLNVWMLNGGKETLSSFLTSSLAKIPNKYLELIQSFKYYYTYDKFIFIHAALNMQILNPFEDIDAILWARNQNELVNYGWLGDRVVIHGHNPTSKKDIMESIDNVNQILCLDNGSFLKKEGYGSLCILELESFSVNFIS